MLWRAVKVSAPDGPDGLSVRFELAQPLAPFLDYTTIGAACRLTSGQRVPITQMITSQLNTHPVGTGPFQFSQITATRAELVPNPRYYAGFNPYLTGLTFRFYPDHQSLLPAFDREEIDGVSWIWPEEMPARPRSARTCSCSRRPLSGYTLVYLNQQNPNVPFFKDVAVRQALLYALDRQALDR